MFIFVWLTHTHTQTHTHTYKHTLFLVLFLSLSFYLSLSISLCLSLSFFLSLILSFISFSLSLYSCYQCLTYILSLIIVKLWFFLIHNDLEVPASIFSFRQLFVFYLIFFDFSSLKLAFSTYQFSFLIRLQYYI
jgi:hypothetical protein